MDVKRINEVLSIIKKAKYKAYLVGGSSRDFIFSRDFKDIDIATNAPLDFLSKTFKVESDEGKSMGSIKINYKKNGSGKIPGSVFATEFELIYRSKQQHRAVLCLRGIREKHHRRWRCDSSCQPDRTF